MKDYLFDKKILEEVNCKGYNISLEDAVFPEIGKNLILRPLSSDDYEKGKKTYENYTSKQICSQNFPKKYSIRLCLIN